MVQGMDDQAKPPFTTPTAAWRAEQERKREAYAAKRRAWMRLMEGHTPEDEEAMKVSPSADEITGARERRRTRGIVHDRRQGKFDF